MPSTNYIHYFVALKKEFPKLRIENKNQHWYWRLMGKLVYIVTFGKNKLFMKNFATTIGYRIGAPAAFFDWPAEAKHQLLIHEVEHIKQQQRLGLGFMPVGTFLWLVLWLFVPLPAIFAWFRYYFERNAYFENIKFTYEMHGKEEAQRTIPPIVTMLSSSSYCWAWIIKPWIRSWFMKRLSKLAA